MLEILSTIIIYLPCFLFFNQNISVMANSQNQSVLLGASAKPAYLRWYRVKQDSHTIEWRSLWQEPHKSFGFFANSIITFVTLIYADLVKNCSTDAQFTFSSSRLREKLLDFLYFWCCDKTSTVGSTFKAEMLYLQHRPNQMKKHNDCFCNNHESIS